MMTTCRIGVLGTLCRAGACTASGSGDVPWAIDEHADINAVIGTIQTNRHADSFTAPPDPDISNVGWRRLTINGQKSHRLALDVECFLDGTVFGPCCTFGAECRNLVAVRDLDGYYVTIGAL